MPIQEGKAASLYTGTFRHRRRPTTLRAIRYRPVPRRWAFWSIQAYSPLTRTKRLDDETLAQVAAKYGKSPAQVLIRWNLQRGIVPIPKANQRGHLEGNIDVFDFHISEGDMATLNGLNERYSSLGMLPYV